MPIETHLPADLQLIVPNLHRRYSGVTATNRMPEQIRGSYQYFTQGEVDRLRGAGYNGGFTRLEDAVELYVKGFLDRADRFR